MGRNHGKILPTRAALIGWGGTAVAVALLGVLLWPTVRRLQEPPPGASTAAPDPEAQRFEGVEIQGRGDGMAFWSLKAVRAMSDAQGRVGSLEGVVARFETGSGEVEARSGRCRADEEGTILFEDGVELRWRDITAFTETARFAVARGMMTTETPVEVRGAGIHIRGQAMELDVNAREARVTGGVRATIGGSER